MSFDNFWAACPRKVGKIACRKSYARQVRIVSAEHPDPHAFLLEAMQRYANSKQVHEGYVTNPLTWLNQGRYYDEPEQAPEVVRAKSSFMDDTTRAEMKRAAEVKAEMRKPRRRPVAMAFDLTKAFDPGWQPPKPWYFPIADPIRDVEMRSKTRC